MKVVILCGGQGTRIRDVSEVLPKPMLPIGGKPLLWHIMKIYAQHGFRDFILCLGYKGWVIKEFFLNYYTNTSDFTMRLGDRDSIVFHNENREADWQITFADTGEESQTAARLLKVREHLTDEETFAVTYGDGVADINIQQLVQAHKKSKLLATVTAVKPLGRFGEIEVEGNHICEFNEKPNVSSGMINGGFMVFHKKIFDTYFRKNLNQSLESDILPQIVKDRKAGVYQHRGFWQCVDTPREYNTLNQLWDNNKAPWKIWEEKQTVHSGKTNGS